MPRKAFPGPATLRRLAAFAFLPRRAGRTISDRKGDSCVVIPQLLANPLIYGNSGAVNDIGPGVSTRLYPLVSHRWVQGVSDGRADTLWALGPTPPVLDHRSSAQTPLAAAAPAVVCPGDQDDSPAPVGGGEVARRVRDHSGDQAGTSHNRLADQHGLHRAREPLHPPACGRGRSARDDPMQRRGGVTPATGPLSPVLQFLFAAW